MYEPLDYQVDLNLTKYTGRYPRDDLKRAKKQAFEDFHKSTSESMLEIVIKHKCGILTKDVVDFRLHDKKPDNFNDSLEFISTRFDFENTFSPVDADEPMNTASGSTSQDIRKVVNNEQMNTLPKSISKETIDRTTNGACSKERTVTMTEKKRVVNVEQESNHLLNDVPKIKEEMIETVKTGNYQNERVVTVEKERSVTIANTKSVEKENQTKHVAVKESYKNELSIEHSCRLCPRSLNLYEQDSNIGTPQSSIGYICDFCGEVSFDKKSMSDHLAEKEHHSASKYMIDASPEEMAQNSGQKLSAILSRTGLKNPKPDPKRTHGVFCPKCKLYFENDILACGIHYKSNHNTNELIYSIGKLKSEYTFNIQLNNLGVHACMECNRTFKKLKDLTVHMNETKHIPMAKEGEINVLLCPFKGCTFYTSYYSLFKTHLFEHKNKERLSGSHAQLVCEVKVYSEATSFMHVAPFVEEKIAERREEIGALNTLLNFIKNQNDPAESRIKERRDYLRKIS